MSRILEIPLPWEAKAQLSRLLIDRGSFLTVKGEENVVLHLGKASDGSMRMAAAYDMPGTTEQVLAESVAGAKEYASALLGVKQEEIVVRVFERGEGVFDKITMFLRGKDERLM